MARDRLRENTFKKCDLHVHSSSCYSRSYSSSSFLKALLDSDLDVVAITDHNSIDVPLLIELSQELKDANKTMFAGVELNIALGQTTIKNYDLTVADKYFHALVICDLKDACSLSDAVDSLFSKDAADLKNALEELSKGSITRKQYSEKTQGRFIFLEDLQRSIGHIKHYFIPHENKGSRNLSDYLPSRKSDGSVDAKNDGYKDRLFYYSHAMAVEGGEKSRKSISLSIAKHLGTTISALLFSDALKLEDIGSKFTWIDFDSDLDSLLLAISDPDSRLRTSDQYCELPQTNSRNFLESISFDVVDSNAANGKRNISLQFAPGYNGIVGSRGSGKSLLAHILDGHDLTDYECFIDKASIRYTKVGGLPTQTPPESIYLAQGALERIFEDKSFSDIELLGKEIEPDKKESEKLSGKAATCTNTMLAMQRDLLLAFIKKYPSGTVSIDYLNSPEPSGIMLRPAPSIGKGSRAQLTEAKDALSQFNKDLGGQEELLSKIELSTAFPEDEVLFKTLANQVALLRSDLLALKTKAGLLLNMLEGCDDSWFELRMQLVSEFSTLLEQLNARDNSDQKNDYISHEKKATGFFEDLLELRLALADLDNQISKSRLEELSPIPSREVHSAEKTITISLGFQDKNAMSYCDHADGLIKGKTCVHLDGLVRAVLCCSESNTVADVFNRGKVKPSSRSNGAKDYISKYYDVLEKELSASKDFNVDIALDGESIKSMSPGMRAHALLHLFLNDAIAEGAPLYVVLDQPEDNLDVKTIGVFLVERLKALKLDVQLFVVSHSAPVVVNGDAREIIVCKNESGEINYLKGTLSEDAVKQEAATVLDGGELYLKMRFNKYNFQIGDAR